MSGTTAVDHPARFSDSILAVLRDVLAAEVERSGALVVLDPLAGSGRVHELASPLIVTRGVELEPEWAGMHPDTACGDSSDLRALGWEAGSVGACLTSPSYGNRMSDSFSAQDDSRRIGYRFALGRPVSPGSGAGMPWGDAYRQLHLRILREMKWVTRPGGLVIVNVSNHIRAGEEQYVAEWWLANMLALGLRLESTVPVETPRMRFGENHAARVEHEWVLVTRRR